MLVSMARNARCLLDMNGARSASIAHRQMARRHPARLVKARHRLGIKLARKTAIQTLSAQARHRRVKTTNQTLSAQARHRRAKTASQALSAQAWWWWKVPTVGTFP